MHTQNQCPACRSDLGRADPAALVLVLRFLADFGYMSSRDVLAAESGVTLEEVSCCQKLAAGACNADGYHTFITVGCSG